MQQQHLMQMQPMMAAYYPNNVTTDHIQQYLDENKTLILKIVESQNSGKLSECAENQARLQRNLMYLAAIADSQPQHPAMPGQYSGSGIAQQGAQYFQGQQMTQQQLMAARSSLLYAQQPFSPLPQHQPFHTQMGISSSTSTPPPPLHLINAESTHVGPSFPDFGRSNAGDQAKQETGSSAEARGGSSGEALFLKPADD
ncbi:GRF1-interacting factor 1-like [Neltuma alba]|uniref:GRF1-interacting factor 1-like n=1 Tax=Neltuma alba TaxID=207710 RepID=UPI0010A4DF90|nr:GRF1-interacting factor 1-like [Prosopis alba]